MGLIYLTVKRSEDKKLPYYSKCNGYEGLHPDDASLLDSVAGYLEDEVQSKIFLDKDYKAKVDTRDRIVFRNNLPAEDKNLRETLDTLVNGHNLAVLLGRSPVRPGSTARSILNGTKKINYENAP